MYNPSNRSISQINIRRAAAVKLPTEGPLWANMLHGSCVCAAHSSSWTLLFVDIKSLLYKIYIIVNQNWCESHSTLADREAAFGNVSQWLIFGFKWVKQHLQETLLACLNLTTTCWGMANDLRTKNAFQSQVLFTDTWLTTHLIAWTVLRW